MLTTSPMVHQLPYHQQSIALFSSWAERPWAVLLDSAHPYSEQGRYDIIAADPYITLVTEGETTTITDHGISRQSLEDPFELLQRELGAVAEPLNGLPFCGGAIGYFGYDLARRLETLPTVALASEQVPQMMIGLYDWAVIIDHQKKESGLVRQGRDPATVEKWSQLIDSFSQPLPVGEAASDFTVTSTVESNMTEQSYGEAFDRIKNYLLEGDCYQVNLAQRFTAHYRGSGWTAYQQLRRSSAAPFCAYLHYPGIEILSSSPERFLKVQGRTVETKPIKGTRPRKPTDAENRQQIEALINSPKDRAENLMIVDLLRNDIGKTCTIGSVRVPKLFEVESFATLHHLVSTICGELERGRHALELLRGAFPGGSITGAPKIRAMEIIEELEPHRRGVYCGAIGYIGFDGNMDSNIAIRTLVCSDNTIRCWAGGAIVADSEVSEEYQESFDKAAAMLDLLTSNYRIPQR